MLDKLFKKLFYKNIQIGPGVVLTSAAGSAYRLMVSESYVRNMVSQTFREEWKQDTLDMVDFKIQEHLADKHTRKKKVTVSGDTLKKTTKKGEK